MSIPALPDLAEATTAALEEAGLSELDPQAAVDPSIALPAVPAQTTAAEPVTVGAVAAPPPAPAVEAPVQAPAQAPRAVSPTPDAPPPPAATQTAPVNVNVSVRVDSPGDNGSVEQANVAVQTGAVPATETVAQYQPDEPQYQESIPASAAPEADSAPQPPAAEPAAQADGWEWNWEWNCGDAVPEIPIPPGASAQNWVWNWDWNCGDRNSLPVNNPGESGSQYQPGVTQYRPININISIRINSPGNDGPVHQTNVAVVVIAPPLPQLRVELPISPTGAATGAPAAAETASPLAFLAAVVDEFTPDAAAVPSDEDDCCPLHEPRRVAAAAEAPQSMLLPQAPPSPRRDITARERFRASVAVTIRLAKASEAAARVARPAPKPAQLRPAPRRAAPTREQAAAHVSAAGFAPLNAPDGRLGTFVLLVALFAFAIAFADATRSVAAEVRAAGEDPDPPPTRPG